MYVIAYLFFTHFLSDYPLQPLSLVRYKKRSFLGVILHSAVHLLTATLILLPFWNYYGMWATVFTIFITHIIIDQSKVNYEKKIKINLFSLYVLDQFSHLTVIIISSLVFFKDIIIPKSEIANKLLADPSYIIFALSLVLLTYVLDISHWVYKNNKKNLKFKRNWKLIIINTTIITILFAVYLLFR